MPAAVTPAHGAAPRFSRPLAAGVLIIVAGVLLLAGLLGGDYLLTIYTATQTARSIEHARTVALQQQQQGEIKGALQECAALQGLAEIKGSHSASATYGRDLQAGIYRVYADSGCPALLKKYGPRS